MKKVLLLTAIVFAQTFAFAITEDENSKQCWDNADSTAAMIACADQDYKVADQHLNETYKSFRAAVKSEKEITQRLVATQRAWITFRDANCKLEGATMLGGTGETPIILGCLARVTNERTAQLEAQKKDLTSEPEL